MPYIPSNARFYLDMGAAPKTPGELNYRITRALLRYLDPNPNYASYNEVIGVLECVKQEFYRRAVALYEDKKALQNGDMEWPQ